MRAGPRNGPRMTRPRRQKRNPGSREPHGRTPLRQHPYWIAIASRPADSDRGQHPLVAARAAIINPPTTPSSTPHRDHQCADLRLDQRGPRHRQPDGRGRRTADADRTNASIRPSLTRPRRRSTRAQANIANLDAQIEAQQARIVQADKQMEQIQAALTSRRRNTAVTRSSRRPAPARYSRRKQAQSICCRPRRISQVRKPTQSRHESSSPCGRPAPSRGRAARGGAGAA